MLSPFASEKLIFNYIHGYTLSGHWSVQWLVCGDRVIPLVVSEVDVTGFTLDSLSGCGLLEAASCVMVLMVVLICTLSTLVDTFTPLAQI